jgi:hypothetical protein
MLGYALRADPRRHRRGPASSHMRWFRTNNLPSVRPRAERDGAETRGLHQAIEREDPGSARSDLRSARLSGEARLPLPGAHMAVNDKGRFPEAHALLVFFAERA